MTDAKQRSTDSTKPTLIQVIMSVMASFFGVQSRKNRERDFTQGNPVIFIVVGLGMTVLFILGVIAAVRLMLNQAGM